jgi:phenylacetate-CoA ligase
MKDRIYFMLPDFLQNVLITIFNIRAYKQRYGKAYWHFRKVFADNRSLSLRELEEIQRDKFSGFVKYAIESSPFYRELYRGIDAPHDISNIAKLPVVNKEMLREQMPRVYTIAKQNGIVSKTGGTTGKSIEVLFTESDMQERFAMLDHFRASFGYELGKKTAWFSGKNLLDKTDIRKRRFWKTDLKHRVRYYSTFHIKNEYLPYYIADLIAFAPEFMVGFPSSMISLANAGKKNNIAFPDGIIKAIFPTAETITPEVRQTLQDYFHAPVYDQYASSEGAPFIVECAHRNLHMELQSGVFEVVDDFGRPARTGKMLVTSFTTQGTPLIRYDIGDSITLSAQQCTCGNHNPLVAEISGRIDDFVYSPENGKINLGNVSNTLKDTKGIVSFQVVQDRLDAIDILVVKDGKVYNESIAAKFLENWRHRVGEKMEITLHYVTEIPVEKSGKFRMVKNNVRNLTDSL